MPGAAAGKTFKLRVREAASMGSVKRDICTKVRILPQWLELSTVTPSAFAPVALDLAKIAGTPLTTLDLLVGPDRTPVPAVEVLLSGRSATFRDMLSTKGAAAEVALPNWQPGTIRLLLKHIYTDQVDLSEQDDEAVVALMAAAEEFKMEKLRVVCESFLVAK
eukprot:SM004909S17357  [mRNA]  locus=s4909:112:1007:- [translate_table: standard]